MSGSPISIDHGLANQRGAALIITAVFMLVAVVCLVLVVDTGRLYYEKRSLQRIADMAALDAASRGGMCSSGNTYLAIAQASAVGNGYTGDLSVSPSSVSAGYIENNAGTRAFVEDISYPEAVRVVATNSVPASIIAGGLFGNEVPLQAVAVARRAPLAGFSLGTGLLAIDSQRSAILNPLLGGLLGSSLNLSAVSYQGIANADINLLSFLNLLRTELGVGTLQEVLDADISLVQFMRISAEAVSTDAAAAASLAEIPLATIKNATLKVSDIIGLEAGAVSPNQALDASLNLFEFIMAGAMAANKDNALALNLGGGAGALAGLNIALTVIEPPVTRFGPPGRAANGQDWRTEARSAQIRLEADLPASVLGLLNSDLRVGIEVAPGHAWLESIDCRSMANNNSRVHIGARTSMATIKIGSRANINNPGSIRVDLLGLLPVVTARAKLDGVVGSDNSSRVSYEVGALPQQQSVSGDVSVSGALNGLQISDVTLLGILPIGVIIDPVVALLNVLVPALDAVLSPLINVLLGLLGVSVSNADVVLLHLEGDGAAELIN